jgi:hypothetical protein
LRIIFSPSNSYQVLHPIEEQVEVIVVQTTIEETNGSPNENTQQSTKTRTPNETQEERDEGNVDAMLKTLDAIVNVFGTLDWVTKKGWPQIPRKQLEEDGTKKTSSSNVADKAFGRGQTILSEP